MLYFGALRTSLPRSEQQRESVGASNLPPFERKGEGHTYPSRSQMAKVELDGVLRSSRVFVSHELQPSEGKDTAFGRCIAHAAFTTTPRGVRNLP